MQTRTTTLQLSVIRTLPNPTSSIDQSKITQPSKQHQTQQPQSQSPFRNDKSISVPSKQQSNVRVPMDDRNNGQSNITQPSKQQSQQLQARNDKSISVPSKQQSNVRVPMDDRNNDQSNITQPSKQQSQQPQVRSDKSISVPSKQPFNDHVPINGRCNETKQPHIRNLSTIQPSQTSANVIRDTSLTDSKFRFACEEEDDKKEQKQESIYRRYPPLSIDTSKITPTDTKSSNNNNSIDAINKKTLMSLPIKDSYATKQSNDIRPSQNLVKDSRPSPADIKQERMTTAQHVFNSNSIILKQLPTSNNKDINVKEQVGTAANYQTQNKTNDSKTKNNAAAVIEKRQTQQSSMVVPQEEKKKDVLQTASDRVNITQQTKFNGQAAAIMPQNNQLIRHEKQNDTIMIASQGGVILQTLATELNPKEIADLKRYHDNSLAKNTRKAYLSDCSNFIEFLSNRYPHVKHMEEKEQIPSASPTSTTSANTSLEYWQTHCTLEHVLAYLNHLCNDGKKIATINRRLSAIKKHILPSLFTKAENAAPGSRDQLILKEVETIIKGMRRTIGAESRIRGKKPLLIEHIRAMCDKTRELRDEDGNLMPNKQCRDRCLLLFLFFSAMRRSEVQALLWSDLTFDARGVQVLIRQSKTDQEAIGQTIGLPRLDDSEYCPVKALEAWRERSNGKGEAPVFRWVSPKDEIQWRVLTDQRIVGVIKDYVAQIGLDPMSYAAHSARSGFVSSGSDKGVPISELMKRTRHKSLSSVQVYMKSDDLFKNAGDAKL